MSDSDDYELPVSEAEEEGEEEVEGDSQKKAKEHAEQLKRLHQKDPEFYQFLEQYDKELLAFGDEDIDDDEETGLGEDKETRSVSKEGPKQSAKSITMEMVDSWCEGIQNGKINPIQSILQAFRAACHYGDGGDNSATKFSIMSSGVFNKVMVFVLKEMDGILRQLLEAPSSGGKKETIRELMITKQWRRYGRLMRVYLGNALHIITEMTDEQMIAFTLKRVKASAVFLAAFPSLLRKYVKVLLHTWARGRGAMPVVSFLFLRDLCVQLGPDCIDACLKGIYKAYLVNCKLSKSVSGSKLQYIQFLANCVTELYAVDPSTAYQHAFVFIRQLAVILRGALTERGPKKAVKDKKDKKQKESRKPTKNQMEKAYQKVYDWQYIFCLELWTNVVCAYSSEEDFRPLAYPLAQIIHGVACLIPSVRYFPLRLRCVKMLNRIAEATGTFIPVSSLLLDMLEMKELRGPPAGGVGKAVNLLNIKQVDKKTVKTRAFQEACVFSVVEELATHLGQWSYSIAFFEMSFIPLVRLRSFCKTIKADRFRREIKDLIRQVEANVEFINSKRLGIGFLPNDPAAESFLKAEKEKHLCPLSKYVATLHERRQNRIDTMDEISVIVGPESSTFARRMSEMQEQDDEGAAVFSSDWLPEKKKTKTAKEKKIKKRSCDIDGVALEEDVVEDLILSSDEEDESDNNHEADDDDSVPVEDDSDADYIDPDNEYKKQKKAKLKKGNKWQQSNKGSSKNKRKPRPKKKAKS